MQTLTAELIEKSLKKDPRKTIVEIGLIYRKLDSKQRSATEKSNNPIDMLEQAVLCVTVLQKCGNELNIPFGTAPSDLGDQGVIGGLNGKIQEYLNPFIKELTKEENERELSRRIEEARRIVEGTTESFTNDEIRDIQEIINELRQKIMDCESLSDEHRKRILSSLEALQREYHKRVSLFRRIYGLLAEIHVSVKYSIANEGVRQEIEGSIKVLSGKTAKADIEQQGSIYSPGLEEDLTGLIHDETEATS